MRRSISSCFGGSGWSLSSSTRYCDMMRSEEHTSELQSLRHLVCRLLLEKKKNSRILIAVNIHVTTIQLKALHTIRHNLLQEIHMGIYVLMKTRHWGLRKSRNATSLNSRF